MVYNHPRDIIDMTRKLYLRNDAVWSQRSKPRLRTNTTSKFEIAYGSNLEELNLISPVNGGL